MVPEFGGEYARRLKKVQKPGDVWHLDEVLIKIGGEQRILWQTVDQEGDTIDVLMQTRRNSRAAKRFFRKLLKTNEMPRRLVTDKRGSYRVAHREPMPSVTHDTGRWANNRAEVSHAAVRQRERQFRRFKSMRHAQRFLSIHSVVSNLFRVGRQKVRATNQRLLRDLAFADWNQASLAREI